MAPSKKGEKEFPNRELNPGLSGESRVSWPPRLLGISLCFRPGSNRRPWDYETHALPTAPRKHCCMVFKVYQQVQWPSGLRRSTQVRVSSEAWVRIPPEPYVFFFRRKKKKKTPSRGIEPRASAWQAEMLPTTPTRMLDARHFLCSIYCIGKKFFFFSPCFKFFFRPINRKLFHPKIIPSRPFG